MRNAKRRPRVDAEAAIAKSVEYIRLVDEQQSNVNVVAAYLERRKQQNGFGTDFEYSLIPKGTK